MRNYKLIIQYDGTNYAGWQIQLNAPSVQGVLQDSISQIINEKINLIGAGRTDSGVHALGQTANFRTESELDLYRFKHSLNSILPRDIAVKTIVEDMTRLKEAISTSYQKVNLPFMITIPGGIMDE